MPKHVNIIYIGPFFTGRPTAQTNAERRLLDALFKNYDRRARPILASNETVPVALQYWLVNINDLVSYETVPSCTQHQTLGEEILYNVQV